MDPLHRAEIADWAAQWVRDKRDMFRSLSKRDPRREGEILWAELHATDGNCNADALCTLIEAAKTDAALFDALCWLGSERVRYATRSQALPPALRFFLADVLIGKSTRPSGSRGKPKPDPYREYWVFLLVGFLVQKFGLYATRNDATEKPDSACDIAAEALRGAGLSPGSYGRVKKAWEHHKARFEQTIGSR